MKSLWELAQENSQPDLQYMDQETLDCIKANKPHFTENPQVPIFSDEDIRLLERLAPKVEWYAEPRIASSIHGIAHSVRIMVCALIMSKGIFGQDDLESLLFACAVHDVRRLNDRGDEEHERRAIEWCRAHDGEFLHMETVIEILEERHVLSSYLRTADALDRYRLPKVKWWIDESYLDLKPTDSIKAFAFELTLLSERARLNGAAEVDSVLAQLIAK